MGQALSSICSTDLFKDLKQKYGQMFVKLMVAEKSKEVVNEEFVKLNSKSDEIFQGFETKTTSIVEEKNNSLTKLFEELKGKVNSTVPGGISAIEKLKGAKIEEFSGFHTLQNKIKEIKDQAFSKIQTEKGCVVQQLNGKKTGMINKIEEERPKLPLYEELPENLKSVVRKQAEEKMSDEIGQNKETIINQVKKQFNLQNVEGLFGKLNPETFLNQILGGAASQFTSSIGLGGGIGNAIGGIGNALGFNPFGPK